MTPIGHLTSSAVVAGSTGMLKPREVFLALAWYVFFLIVFAILTANIAPGMWGMHVYDTFSDVPFYLLVIIWMRARPRRQLALALGIGNLILPAYSHLFDKIFLWFMDRLPEGMFRPHNILHSPMAGLILCTLCTPLLCWLMKRHDRLAIWGALMIGYLLHITVDTITYDYPIYWLWPFSDYHTTFITAFQQPDAVSQWLGNPYFVASPPVRNNPQGYIMYTSEVLLDLLLGAFYVMIVGFRHIANKPEHAPRLVPTPDTSDE